MKSTAWSLPSVLIVAGLMVIGSMSIIPFAQAESSSPEKVPLPQILERHEYEVPASQNGNSTYINHEVWGISFFHGNMSTNIGARNITQYSDNATWVDYTNNIEYNTSGARYIAQFMMTESVFKIGNQTIVSTLKTCADFTVEYSSIRYNGTVPTFDLNISFDGIRVYTNGHKDSTYDLKLIHHIVTDWNRTDDKIEAVFDFNDTRFYQANGTEFNAGEPFTAEVHYRMYMTRPDAPENQRFIAPTGLVGNTLEYNLTLDNGSPLTLSKLNMKDNFTIYNASGVRASVGYSSLVPGEIFSSATHGFPNMTYRDTTSMKSDPQVTVYHDRATEQNSQNNMGNPTPPNYLAMIAFFAVVIVGAIGAVVLLRRRRKDKGKGSETKKKP